MKEISNKIKGVNGDTDPADIMTIHESLTKEEDKLQLAYDEGMRKLQSLREELDRNSNPETTDE